MRGIIFHPSCKAPSDRQWLNLTSRLKKHQLPHNGSPLVQCSSVAMLISPSSWSAIDQFQIENMFKLNSFWTFKVFFLGSPHYCRCFSLAFFRRTSFSPLLRTAFIKFPHVSKCVCAHTCASMHIYVCVHLCVHDYVNSNLTYTFSKFINLQKSKQEQESLALNLPDLRK